MPATKLKEYEQEQLSEQKWERTRECPNAKGNSTWQSQRRTSAPSVGCGGDRIGENIKTREMQIYRDSEGFMKSETDPLMRYHVFYMFGQKQTCYKG